MSTEPPATDITRNLASAAHDPASQAAVLDGVYAELLKIARAELRRHKRGATLNTRALVNEAYLKLFAPGAAAYVDRKHFYATASRAMRQVVIDYARQRLAERRGAGAAHVCLDDLVGEAFPIDSQAERLLAIDAALTRLDAMDPRLAQVVELRFFAGMEVTDLAELLEVSVPTIVRDTRTAKAFLQKEIG